MGVASYQLGQYNAKEAMASHSVSYVESKEKQRKISTKEELTPDQVSAEEGIDAEQIVIKITDKGYVTSHGDHYHFFNGKVPYDAIISEELVMKDPSYVLNESDIINEVKDGYIIKVKGQYYLYLKSNSQRSNVRSKADIDNQRNKYSQHDSSIHQGATVQQLAQAKSQGRYTTDDGYIFSPTDVIDDFGDAFLVPHGDHFHYIPKKDLSPDELAAAQAYWNQKKGQVATGHTRPYSGQVAVPRPKSPRSVATPPSPHRHVSPAPKSHVAPTPKTGGTPSKPADAPLEEWEILLQQLYQLPLNQRHVESDGLVFDPVQIVRRVPQGVVVPHGNHYHVIPYNRMSPLEAKIARMIPIGARPRKGGKQIPTPKVTPPAMTQPTPKVTPPTSPQEPKQILLHFQGKTFPAVKKGLDGKPYTTSDGYTFTTASIYSVDSDGLTTRHTDHLHFVPFNELEQYELDQVTQWIEQQKKNLGKLFTVTEMEQALQALLEKNKDIPNESIRLSFDKQVRVLQARLAAVQNGKSLEPVFEIQKEYQQIARAIDNELENPTPNGDGQVRKTASEIYAEVTAEKIVPLEAIPYNLVQTVEIKDGHIFVIPHWDHYHNIRMELFDTGLYNAPNGYTLKQLFATVKYYVTHPEERPKEEGWGDDSDHGRGKKGGQDFPHDVEPDDEVDIKDSPAGKALYEELWKVAALVEELPEGPDRTALEEESDALFDRYSELTARGTDTIEAIQKDLAALKAKILAKQSSHADSSDKEDDEKVLSEPNLEEEV